MTTDRRTGPARGRGPALAGVAGALLAGAVLTAPAALAEEPLDDVSGVVTDLADVFSATEEEQILERAAELEEATGVGFYVVTVDDFGGSTGNEWADETAIGSGHGTDEVLLALAPSQQEFGFSAAAELMDDAAYETVVDDYLDPALGSGDMIAAATSTIEGTEQVMTSGGGSDDGPTESWDGPGLGVIAAIAGGGILLIGVIGNSLTGNRRARSSGRTGAGAQSGAAAIPLPQLRQDTDRFLLGADDALAATEQEIEFAEAEFGAQATESSRTVLGTARTALTTAFSEVAKLDEQTPEQQQRHILLTANDEVEEAMTALQAEANAIASLRNDVANAPERIRRLRDQLAELGPRLTALDGTIAALASRWSHAAVRAVVDHPEQAREAAASARAHLDQAEALAGQVTASSALIRELRGAESDAARSTTLTEAVESLDESTEDAAAGLQGLGDEVKGLLVQARATQSTDPRLAQYTALAQQILASAPEEGTTDPLAVSSRLEDVRAKLDGVLARTRSDYDATQSATRDLTRTSALAEAEIDTAESLVTTHRDVVGTGTRTTLAQAEALLDKSEDVAGTDPVAAADLAGRALDAARSATSQARADIDAQRRPAGYTPANTGADILGDVFQAMNRSHYRGGGYYPMGVPPIIIGGGWDGSRNRGSYGGSGWSGGWSSGSRGSSRRSGGFSSGSGRRSSSGRSSGGGWSSGSRGGRR